MVSDEATRLGNQGIFESQSVLLGSEVRIQHRGALNDLRHGAQVCASGAAGAACACLAATRASYSACVTLGKLSDASFQIVSMEVGSIVFALGGRCGVDDDFFVRSETEKKKKKKKKKSFLFLFFSYRWKTSNDKKYTWSHSHCPTHKHRLQHQQQRHWSSLTDCLVE
jgi:hypothetical protein